MSKKPKSPSRSDRKALQVFVPEGVLLRFNAACELAGRERNEVAAELLARFADESGIPQHPPKPKPRV